MPRNEGVDPPDVHYGRESVLKDFQEFSLSTRRGVCQLSPFHEAPWRYILKLLKRIS